MDVDIQNKEAIKYAHNLIERIKIGDAQHEVHKFILYRSTRRGINKEYAGYCIAEVNDPSRIRIYRMYGEFDKINIPREDDVIEFEYNGWKYSYAIESVQYRVGCPFYDCWACKPNLIKIKGK